MVLHCETASASEALAQTVAVSIREMTQLRGEVVFCAPGTLANDGKVIEARQAYS